MPRTDTWREKRKRSGSANLDRKMSRKGAEAGDTALSGGNCVPSEKAYCHAQGRGGEAEGQTACSKVASSSHRGRHFEIETSHPVCVVQRTWTLLPARMAPPVMGMSPFGHMPQATESPCHRCSPPMRSACPPAPV